MKAAVENRDVGLKPQVQKEFEKSWNQKEPEDEPEIIDIPDDPPEPAGSSMFLPSSSSTSGMSLKMLDFKSICKPAGKKSRYIEIPGR